MSCFLINHPNRRFAPYHGPHCFLLSFSFSLKDACVTCHLIPRETVPSSRISSAAKTRGPQHTKHFRGLWNKPADASSPQGSAQCGTLNSQIPPPLFGLLEIFETFVVWHPIFLIFLLHKQRNKLGVFLTPTSDTETSPPHQWSTLGLSLGLITSIQHFGFLLSAQLFFKHVNRDNKLPTNSYVYFSNRSLFFRN